MGIIHMLGQTPAELFEQDDELEEMIGLIREMANNKSMVRIEVQPT